MGSAAQRWVGEVLHWVWPARCAGCDVALAHDGLIFCGSCGEALNPIPRACQTCASPLTDGGAVGGPAVYACPACVHAEFAFTRAVAGFEYGAALAKAIVRMKHGDRAELAPRLGRLLAESFWRAAEPGSAGVGTKPGQSQDAGARVDGVVPVPLHPKKLRRRGFNQALALALGALRARPRWLAPGATGPGPRLERDLLRRIRDTPELGRTGPRERRATVAGAFAARDTGRVRGRRFLVVDDVMTTGATLDACADALLVAGALEVRVVALARAVSTA
jgi:predicted amidophosphoribosyltransferase